MCAIIHKRKQKKDSGPQGPLAIAVSLPPIHFWQADKGSVARAQTHGPDFGAHGHGRSAAERRERDVRFPGRRNDGRGTAPTAFADAVGGGVEQRAVVRVVRFIKLARVKTLLFPRQCELHAVFHRRVWCSAPAVEVADQHVGRQRRSRQCERAPEACARRRPQRARRPRRSAGRPTRGSRFDKFEPGAHPTVQRTVDLARMAVSIY